MTQIGTIPFEIQHHFVVSLGQDAVEGFWRFEGELERVGEDLAVGGGDVVDGARDDPHVDEPLLEVDEVDHRVQRQDGADGHGPDEVQLVQLEEGGQRPAEHRRGDDGDLQAQPHQRAPEDRLVGVLVLDVRDRRRLVQRRAHHPDSGRCSQ